MKRCDWAKSNKLEMQYHDHEWGVAVHDDSLLFEILTLESAQSGLSWLTILKKREGYRKAFDQFDINKVSKYTDNEVEKLLHNPNIIRHKLKILATIENSKQIIKVQQQYGSFDSYIWSFTESSLRDNLWNRQSDVPSSTIESTTMSKALKKRGFKFIGPTTCYSFMQASGMVNDHITSCFRHDVFKK
jgi:DNA-3-methyladenine glycosylase I